VNAGFAPAHREYAAVQCETPSFGLPAGPSENEGSSVRGKAGPDATDHAETDPCALCAIPAAADRELYITQCGICEGRRGQL